MATKFRPTLGTRRVVKRRPYAPGSAGKTAKLQKSAKGLFGRAWAFWTSKKGLKILAIAAGSGFALLVLTFLWFAKDLPSPNKINARVAAQTTKFYDNTGNTVLYEVYGNKNRSLIEFNQMPKNIRNATVAIEDKDFYKHGAFSFFGIARAFSGLIFRDPSKGGGSTITQQYVKNAFLTGERSFGRKIQELILAIEIELLYNKDDILKLYLNEIPYGSTAYGIEAASKTYFGIPAKDLSLAQASMLAALPQAPSFYSPYGRRTDALIARQRTVLTKMVEQGYITQKEADEAKKVDILAQVKPQNLYANITAPHFVQYVREQLEDKYGVKEVNEGGLKVITTLDLAKQKMAEDAITKQMPAIRRSGGSNAALVSADPRSGEVVAMVGSYNYGDKDFGSFNVAVANRQPGSSMKPLVYANLFKNRKDYGPGSTMYDVKTDFGGGYTPKNYDGRHYGVLSVRQTLSNSLNIPAIKALYLGGQANFIETAKDMGLTTLDQPIEDYGLSLALGTGEVKVIDMVNAFGALANGGVRHEQVYVKKITDSRGKVLEENKPENTIANKNAIDPQIAYLISNILADNRARSSLGIFPVNNPLTLGNRPVAAKTGTTSDFKDAWTMGYTTRLVTGVWAGNNDNTPMSDASVIIAAPVWQEYMRNATKDDPIENFSRPNGIKNATIDAFTGRAPTSATKQTRSDEFASWYELPKASATSTAKIDKVSGKLATECTPPDAIDTVTGGGISAEVSPSDPAYQRWQPPVAALAASLGLATGGLPTAKDDVHKCSDVKPKVSITVTPNSGSTFAVTANVTSGTFTANKLILLYNGSQVDSQNINGSGIYALSYSPTQSGSGSFTVKVVDAGLYSATSNDSTVSVVAGADSPTVGIDCSGSRCVTLFASKSGGNINSVAFFYNGGAARCTSTPNVISGSKDCAKIGGLSSARVEVADVFGNSNQATWSP